MQKIALFGTGIIGGSIARSLYNSYEIYGISYDANGQIFKEIISPEYNEEIQKILEICDYIIITTHVWHYEALFAKIVNIANISNKIIIECSSVKGYPAKLAEKYKLNMNYVHHIAGSEKSGFRNSHKDLLANKPIIYFSENKNNAEIEKLFENCNFGEKFCISIAKHDEIYAKTSHFMQLIAYLLRDFAKISNTQYIFDGQKFSRLFDSNKAIWMDEFGIIALNYDNIKPIFDDFIAKIVEFKPKSPENLMELTINFFKILTQDITDHYGDAIKDLLDFHIKPSENGQFCEKIYEFFSNINLKNYIWK